MNISQAMTSPERDAAQQLFEDTFANLPGDAVPSYLEGHPVKPVLAIATDDAGEVVGAALACRPVLVARALESAGVPPLRRMLNERIGWDLACYESVPDLVYELDLMAVAPDSRGNGVGEGLVRFVETALTNAGVHALIGHATPAMGGAEARGFYERCGFAVLKDGRDIPKFVGRRYSVPGRLLAEDERPVFNFYKILNEPPDDAPRVPVVPPKARRQSRGVSRRT